MHVVNVGPIYLALLHGRSFDREPTTVAAGEPKKPWAAGRRGAGDRGGRVFPGDPRWLLH
jgi:hypothetical protein